MHEIGIDKGRDKIFVREYIVGKFGLAVGVRDGPLRAHINK